MPKSRRGPANKEDTMSEELSSSRAARSRRALVDVSNNNSQDGAADGNKDTNMDDTEKRSLRRSQRLSNVPREDREPINGHETSTAAAAAAAAPPRNHISKIGRTSKIQGKSNDNKDTSIATTVVNRQDSSQAQVPEAMGVTENDESESSDDMDRKPEASTKTNANRTTRTKKRTNQENFDIEAVLLEPKPKRRRLRSTSTSSTSSTTVATKEKSRSEEVSGGEVSLLSDSAIDASSTTVATKKNSRSKEEVPDVEVSLLPDSAIDASSTTVAKKKKSRSEEEVPDVEVSLLPDSAIGLNLTKTNRCPDLLVTSEDDHCLLRKLEGPFDASKYTTGIAIYDKGNEGDVNEVPSYVTDIFQRLFDAEEISRPSPSYMTNEQQEINSAMRAILIDWLVVVHTKYRLLPETLYLCVNIIDRYLSRASVHRQRLQLLGVTALFVACKYEEIYPPEVKDCVYITDRAFTRQDVLDMESDIVMVLNFKMTVPTAYPFLQRFLHITNAPSMVRDLASFYTERMLQEYCMLNFRASLVASTAVCLAWNNPTVIESFEKKGSTQDLPRARVLEMIINYTGFCEAEIRHTAKVICDKIRNSDEQENPPRRQLTGVHKKYRSDRYCNASCYDYPDVSYLDSS